MKALLITLLAISALAVVSCDSPQPVDDSVITTKVKSKLAADTRTSAIKISVETTNGVVALTGTVPTQSEKSAAEEITKSTEGVKSVDNKIAVNPNSGGATNVGEKAGEAASSAGQAVGDSAITGKIKTKLVAVGIIGTNVDTVNGAVTLKGRVDNAQEKALAEKLAKETENVKSVKNELAIEKK
jgi:hyperosmotically inducible periplasmic protein